ncbi:MAG: 2-oxo acid dehydrogenase subunit E2 [Proteobacteria bacterium]|nr:2-oxo acid dehydrogenase subunit E2 [Pseudomonadota bacterium]
MTIFKLPDLGEGLPDAIIREWYVKPGDKVKADQPLVSMETAKALVDVPSPQSGEIEKCFGIPGDTIETGQPLVGFVSEGKETKESPSSEKAASAQATETKSKETGSIKATPAVRSLAKKLGVDLSSITPRSERITAEEVEAAARHSAAGTAGFETLTPIRKAMVLSMNESHKRVVPVTLCDDADIFAWKDGTDISVRLIRALIAACKAVPILNATFDDQQMAVKHNTEVNLGIAVDTEHGLYVPVLKNAEALSDQRLRERINEFKQQARQKALHQADLHGATITLSNFGALAGRYGNPIIVPPMVAIVGVGKSRDAVVAYQGQPAVHRILPLSITIDHRVVTGGEAARFLKAMIDELA